MTRIIYFTLWSVMALLALVVVAASAQYFIFGAENVAPPPLLWMVTERKVAFLFHVGGGIIALATGVLNLLGRLRERYLNVHRWLGRTYLVSVLVSGVAGLSLAFTSQGGLAAHFGFGFLAVLWLATAVLAYRRIRAFDIEAHRRWMIRNYALTFAAVTLRLWIPLLVLGFGYQFSDVYPAVAWLGWVPNLIVAEMICGRLKASATRPQTQSVAATT